MSRKRKISKKESSTEAKKAAVLGTDRKSKAPALVALAVTAALAAGGFFLLGGKKGTGPVAATAVASTDTSEFTYPLTDFGDGKSRYFSFTSPQGIKIRYFIMRSSDGIIRAAFDACDTCWQTAKGYHQEGDFMVCNNCGLRFASVKINEVKGGCNPSPLSRTIRGEKLVIKVQDIVEQGTPYFNFARRG